MRKFVYHITMEVYSDGDEAEAKEDVYDSLPKSGSIFGVTAIEKVEIHEQN